MNCQHYFQTRNVNGALSTALYNLINVGSKRKSRNGEVFAFPYPVITEYEKPCERVLFSGVRNANPVFHLMEALWMLRGRRDLAFPMTFVKRMTEFSDDGKTLWGAYGHRWREFFGFDQITFAIKELRKNPQSRRVVIEMWNAMPTPASHKWSATIDSDIVPDIKLGAGGARDVPCNTHLYLDVRDGKLNMTICCRSNDIIWGAYGANAVHFSVLQEYIARAVGVPVGRMYQLSNDLHLYLGVLKDSQIIPMALDAHRSDYYDDGCAATPLIAEGEHVADFDNDLEEFFECFDVGGIEKCLVRSYETQFFNFVVTPMLSAWDQRKENTDAAIKRAALIGGADWRIATREWIGRNYARGGSHAEYQEHRQSN